MSIRLRTRCNEIIVCPDPAYTIIIVHDPNYVKEPEVLKNIYQPFFVLFILRLHLKARTESSMRLCVHFHLAIRDQVVAPVGDEDEEENDD